jgi:hypothetical protein
MLMRNVTEGYYLSWDHQGKGGTISKFDNSSSFSVQKIEVKKE